LLPHLYLRHPLLDMGQQAEELTIHGLDAVSSESE